MKNISLDPFFEKFFSSKERYILLNAASVNQEAGVAIPIIGIEDGKRSVYCFSGFESAAAFCEEQEIEAIDGFVPVALVPEDDEWFAEILLALMNNGVHYVTIVDDDGECGRIDILVAATWYLDCVVTSFHNRALVQPMAILNYPVCEESFVEFE